MEHLPENNAEQSNRSAEIPLTSLGRMLREARERFGLSVADVAAQIKFAPRQIEALEADDFKHLPEAAFLRGFVRSYAKILHLDAQTLLAAHPGAKSWHNCAQSRAKKPRFCTWMRRLYWRLCRNQKRLRQS